MGLGERAQFHKIGTLPATETYTFGCESASLLRLYGTFPADLKLELSPNGTDWFVSDDTPITNAGSLRTFPVYPAPRFARLSSPTTDITDLWYLLHAPRGRAKATRVGATEVLQPGESGQPKWFNTASIDAVGLFWQPSTGILVLFMSPLREEIQYQPFSWEFNPPSGSSVQQILAPGGIGIGGGSTHLGADAMAFKLVL